jgi:hypothetical protein
VIGGFLGDVVDNAAQVQESDENKWGKLQNKDESTQSRASLRCVKSAPSPISMCLCLPA